MFGRRRRGSDDLSEEIRAHLDLETERLRDEGFPEDQARAAAHRNFGSPTRVEEGFYENGRWNGWDHLRQDVRFAARTLSRSPGFTIAAALTLALGIGATSAIFSVIDAALLRPLPFPDPERLMALWVRSDSGEQTSFSPADFLDYRAQSRSFRALAAYREESISLTGDERPERVRGAVVTPDFFEVFGVAASTGRALRPDRDGPGNSFSIVLGDAIWRRRYGSDPSIVGRSIDVDGEPRTVVGILPPSFDFPPGAQLWVPARHRVPTHPLQPTVDPSNLRDSHYLEAVGRLKVGVAPAEARAEVDGIGRRLRRQYGDVEEGAGADLVPLREEIVGDARPALRILFGAVTLLLLIACANVANIVLARGSGRRKEIAIRAALGAGRGRIVRQLVTESVVLSIVGGVLGILLAQWAMGPLRATIPSGILSGSPLTVDGRVLAFTAAVSLLTGILFGLFPAFQLASSRVGRALNEGGRGQSGGAQALRTRRFLVGSEIALAAVLLFGAGLLAKSLQRLLSVPRGFRPEGVLTMELSLPAIRYPGEEKRAVFAADVLARIQALPGVLSASVVSRLPLNGGASTRSMEVSGRIDSPGGDPSPDYQVVSPDYFRALAIPLVRGRLFTERDDARAPTAVIVSAATARRFWPGQDPVGGLVKAGPCKDWCRVVGVVGDLRQHALDRPPRETVYVPYAQDPWTFLTLVVRTRTDPAGARRDVEAAIHAVDPDEPVSNVRTLEEVVAKSLSARRLRTQLLGLFALLALVLACVGLYGVMAYSVAQRSHEIGIRMALGAEPAAVVRLVVGQGLWLALAGIGAGLVFSLALGRLLSNLLYGVRPTDAGTLAAISLILTAVALLASLLPAWRATRVDPAVALRTE